MAGSISSNDKQLISTQTFVESPFVIVKIGDYTFGSASKVNKGGSIHVTYPNYMKGVQIVKINGQVNQ